jgi:hypothetical protein
MVLRHNYNDILALKPLFLRFERYFVVFESHIGVFILAVPTVKLVKCTLDNLDLTLCSL